MNINDVVNQFAPGASTREINGKIIFSNGEQFEIVADVVGGYLRIQDVSAGKLTYVTLSGEYKPKSIDKSKRKQMTHYRIKKLKDCNYGRIKNHAGYKCIVAALSKEVDYDNYGLDDPNIKVYEFNDSAKFSKYIMSDFINEIAEKCNADWLDDYEEQPLFPDTLPIAIEIISKAIKQRKNTDIIDYLEQTKELMEIALANDTFM